MDLKFKMVINGTFGGFSLTDEVVERLRKKGCTWTDKLGKASARGHWYPNSDFEKDEVKYRRDPIFVEVVEEIHAGLESRLEGLESWQEREELTHQMIRGLKVVQVSVVVEIEDYAGKETVQVRGGTY